MHYAWFLLWLCFDNKSDDPDQFIMLFCMFKKLVLFKTVICDRYLRCHGRKIRGIMRESMPVKRRKRWKKAKTTGHEDALTEEKEMRGTSGRKIETVLIVLERECNSHGFSLLFSVC